MDEDTKRNSLEGLTHSQINLIGLVSTNQEFIDYSTRDEATCAEIRELIVSDPVIGQTFTRFGIEEIDRQVKLCKYISYRLYKAGECVIKQGNKHDLKAYVIVHGSLIVMKDPKRNLTHLTYEERQRVYYLADNPTGYPTTSPTSDKSPEKYSNSNSLTVPLPSKTLPLSPIQMSRKPSIFTLGVVKLDRKKSILMNPSPQIEQFHHRKTVAYNKQQMFEEVPDRFLDFSVMSIDEIEYYVSKYDEIRYMPSNNAITSDYLLVLKKIYGNVLRELFPGSCFGERGVQGAAVRTASICAKTDCHVLVIEMSTFQEDIRNLASKMQRIKSNLLQKCFPETQSYNYEDFFQFQFGFHEHTIGRNVVIFTGLTQLQRPLLLSHGSVSLTLEITQDFISKFNHLLQDMPPSNPLHPSFTKLSELMKRITPPLSLPIVALSGGEVIGDECLVADFKKVLFTATTVSSSCQYFTVPSLKAHLLKDLVRTAQQRLVYRLRKVIHELQAKIDSRPVQMRDGVSRYYLHSFQVNNGLFEAESPIEEEIRLANLMDRSEEKRWKQKGVGAGLVEIEKIKYLRSRDCEKSVEILQAQESLHSMFIKPLRKNKMEQMFGPLPTPSIYKKSNHKRSESFKSIPLFPQSSPEDKTQTATYSYFFKGTYNQFVPNTAQNSNSTTMRCLSLTCVADLPPQQKKKKRISPLFWHERMQKPEPEPKEFQIHLAKHRFSPLVLKGMREIEIDIGNDKQLSKTASRLHRTTRSFGL